MNELPLLISALAREAGELRGILKILLTYKDVEQIHALIRKELERIET